jgi:hypothetical protein
MTDTKTPVKAQPNDNEKTQDDKPQFFRVVLTHPGLNGRTVFRSVSEKRARTWLENHYPRGSEAHLVTPSGETHHYEAERAGERGQDVELWQPFDPKDWLPPEQQSPPGQDAWADTEG